VKHLRARNIVFALFAWVLASSALGWATLAGLAAFAPTWHAGDGPIVVVVAETYFLLAVVVLFTVGGFRGLRERLSFRYTSMRDIALALSVWVATLCAIAL